MTVVAHFKRMSVDEIQLRIAELWSLRGTCNRLHVGAVLSYDGRTLVSGYNGAPPGVRHCSCAPGGVDPANPCFVSVHAEANVIAYAARYGISTEGTTLYCTHSPCIDCAKLMVSAGVHRVVYVNEFKDTRGIDLLRSVDVQVEGWLSCRL